MVKCQYGTVNRNKCVHRRNRTGTFGGKVYILGKRPIEGWEFPGNVFAMRTEDGWFTVSKDASGRQNVKGPYTEGPSFFWRIIGTHLEGGK